MDLCSAMLGLDLAVSRFCVNMRTFVPEEQVKLVPRRPHGCGQERRILHRQERPQVCAQQRRFADVRQGDLWLRMHNCTCQHTSVYVSIRQYTSVYVSIRQYTSAYVSIRQHTSAYVSSFSGACASAAGGSHAPLNPYTPASVFVLLY
jgi:hypothetical protein